VAKNANKETEQTEDRDKVIKVRLTEAEQTKVRMAAARENTTMAMWARKKILEAL
jgi:hypothetical protein